MSKARQLADLGNQIDDGAITGSNMVVNGAMTVAQRGTSASPAPIGYLIDRFATFKSGGGTYSLAQSTDAPVGFSHSMLVTVTSASTPSGGDYYLTQQVIEGYNASVLSLGTSNAQNFTLSFYVKSSLTGTFSGSFRDGVEALTYVFEYTVNAANTWERKTVTIAGTSSGTFPTNNTASLKLCFSLGQGSTYATSTVGSWVSGSYHGSTTETDLIASAGATWQITGVCLNVGDSAIAFPHESYGDTLAKCQRYFYRQAGTKLYYRFGVGFCTSTTNGNNTVFFPVPMRAEVSFSSSGTFAIHHGSGPSVSTTTGLSIDSQANGTQGITIDGTTTGLTAGNACQLIANFDSSAYIDYDAEL